MARVKRSNKEALAERIRSATGIVVDPDALFDIQVKRIHEYKRQHLNALYIITLYQRLRSNPQLASRRAASSSAARPHRAMHGQADHPPDQRRGRSREQRSGGGGRLKVVFLPDFNVKNAPPSIPAADLSEQISTAGKEASGTGNMKFMMNGALTIGTLDGANVEIREEVGEDNFFLFGLTAEQVEQVKRDGYRPADCAKRKRAVA